MDTKPSGWLCVADPDWLDFLSRQIDLRSLIYYKGPYRPLTQLPRDAPFFCCRRGETPRRLHLVGMFNGYVVQTKAQAWSTYQRRLGVATKQEWDGLEIGKDGKISSHELVNYRFLDTPVPLSNTGVTLTDAASSMGRYLTASESQKILTAIGGLDSASLFDPREIVNPIGLFEGALTQVLANAYERNATARAECLKHYGYSCSVCGMNFLERYGQIGEGYIHVHHLVLLSTIKAEYKIDPIRDLRPVCPNCHAMLHTRTPPFDIHELREILERGPQRTGQPESVRLTQAQQEDVK